MKRSDALAPVSREHHHAHEERVLFPAIERELDETGLAALGEAVAAAQAR